MGTSYAPYCIDCDDEHWFDDCRDVPALQTLVKNAKQVAALETLLSDLRAGWADPGLWLNYSRDKLDIGWFVKHANHRLTVRDEYGKCLEECGEYFPCGSCGHRKRCMRLHGHEGGHAEVRDTPQATGVDNEAKEK